MPALKIPPNKRLETSAVQTVRNGADVLVVTGESTGKKTPREKLARVRGLMKAVDTLR